MTPEAVHYGWAEEINAARQDTLLSAYAIHPERFVRKVPEPPLLPRKAWINPPSVKAEHEKASEVKLITPGDTGMLSELCEIDGNHYIEMAAVMQNLTKEVLH
jgi:hypothetical protein